MATAFKLNLNAQLIQQAARLLNKADSAFNEQRFCQLACEPLEQLELKARSLHIAHSLLQCLPHDFAGNCALISNVLRPAELQILNDNAKAADVAPMSDKGISGWFIMPICEWVVLAGIEQPDIALAMLAKLTSLWSAEFAIRPFIERYPEKTWQFITQLSQSDNAHHRRLASEGSRPRLPWGIKLQQGIDDPSANLQLLASLLKDNNAYVRKSVANHLNDIAKDHATLVITFAQQHWSDSSQTQQLLKHGLRTLLKQGHPEALALLGYHDVEITCQFSLLQAEVCVGENLKFNLTLNSAQTSDVMLDYVIYFMKANGKQSAKVFKWRKLTLEAGKEITIAGQQSFKEVTTRKLYSGQHHIAVQINGVLQSKTPFMLA